jgi:hypothetical protein
LKEFIDILVGKQPHEPVEHDLALMQNCLFGCCLFGNRGLGSGGILGNVSLVNLAPLAINFFGDLVKPFAESFC